MCIAGITCDMFIRQYWKTASSRNGILVSTGRHNWDYSLQLTHFHPCPWRTCSGFGLTFSLSSQHKNHEVLTNRIGVKEPTGSSNDTLKHVVMELNGRLHTHDKEVDSSDHRGHTESSNDSSVNSKVEVVVSRAVVNEGGVYDLAVV